MMHDEKCLEKNHNQLIIEPSKWGSKRVIGIKVDDTKLAKDATWVACPMCKSQNINKVQSPHWVVSKEERWCRCRFCGNKFVV
jgi:predicted Zn-ribbon and HTH transcriptional regulator